jgi:hypothetical protein
MEKKRSGNAPFQFVHRDDLHVLPSEIDGNEEKLHGGFALDPRAEYGHLYYGMPESGLIRVAADLKRQELISLPDKLKAMNFHSTKMGRIAEKWYLFLPANDDALVAVLTLDGKLEFLLPRPEFEQYQDREIRFAPTDTVLVDEQLFVADGYGANYVLSADVQTRRWSGLFGGKTENPQENGRFSTAHGLALHPDHPHHLMIADRPNSRLQVHDKTGDYLASLPLPPGSWPCGINILNDEGRSLAVIGSLYDPVKDRPAPIYILDIHTQQVVSTIRPKEELGLQAVQHMHNVVWHKHRDQTFLVCQSWNPGYYFVLEKV